MTKVKFLLPARTYIPLSMLEKIIAYAKKQDRSKSWVIKQALVKSVKGKSIITWAVHYKNESVWCNSMEDVAATLTQITMVQLHGDDFKTWKNGKGGWRRNSKKD